jgi:nitroimidazol reductase NimA-like FMN-containing flavoprotein (pyridoxamine 5'-phosphate oxidase superfamily)
MKLVDPRSGIDVLDRDQCLALLQTDVIGRLAVVAGGTPAVFPVNYAMDGDAVVFRTAPGTKLDAGNGASACFEIDSFDRDRRTGWSVVVSGRLEEATSFDGLLLDRLKTLAVDPWAEGVKEHWMRLVPHIITGRSVGPPP